MLEMVLCSMCTCCSSSPSEHNSSPKRAPTFHKEYLPRFYLEGSHSVYMEEGVGWAADRECSSLISYPDKYSTVPWCSMWWTKLQSSLWLPWKEPRSSLVGLTTISLFWLLYQFNHICLSLKNFSKYLICCLNIMSQFLFSHLSYYFSKILGGREIKYHRSFSPPKQKTQHLVF